MIRFEAPIMLTGFAALSVETQKYFAVPDSTANLAVDSVLRMLVFIIRIRV